MSMSRSREFMSSGEVAEDEVHGTFRQLSSPPLSRRNSAELSGGTDSEREDNFDKA